MADVDWPGSEQIKQQRVFPPGPDPIWYCKIGLKPGVKVAMMKNPDAPMRSVIANAFKNVVGHYPDFIFSGWSASLTENELHVVENRNYERQDHETTLELTEEEIVAYPVKQVISPEEWKIGMDIINDRLEKQLSEYRERTAEPVQHFFAQPTEEYVKHGHKPVTSYGDLARKLAERAHQREYLRKLEDLLMKAECERDDFYARAVKAQTGGGNFLRIRQELAMHEATITEIKAEIEREKGKIAMTTAATLRCCDGHFDLLNNGYVHQPSCLKATLGQSVRPADVAVDAGEDVTMQAKDASFGEELTSLINRHSLENDSNTPDFILADFFQRVHEAFARTTLERDSWRGSDSEEARQPETNFGFYVDGYTISHDPENIGGVKIMAMDGRTETIKTSQLCAFLERRLPEPD